MTDPVYPPLVKQPCSGCPFRRASLPGWLGASSPEGFLDCLQRDEPLPCHQTVDYDDPRWLEAWTSGQGGRMCAGALVFLANRQTLPRARGFPRLPPPDRVSVFDDAVDFVRHHREAAVRSWDDADQDEGARLHQELVGRAAEARGWPIVDFGNKKRRGRVPGEP